MLRATFCLAVLSAATMLAAQNEIVFAGSLAAGPADPHFFVSAATGTVVSSASLTATDDVTSAAWLDRGANLYCARSSRNDVMRGQWNGTSATWSPFHTAAGPCHGLASVGNQLWMLTGATSTTRELECVGADPANAATYGSVLFRSTSLGGVLRERWAMSHYGWLAAVPHMTLQGGGQLQLVDMQSWSPTFLTVVLSAPLATASALTTVDVAFSEQDIYAYLLYSRTGGQALAVFHAGFGTLLDFDPTTPGQQDFAIPLSQPTQLAVSRYGWSICVIGQGNGGWAARIDLDPRTPANTTFTPLAATGCTAAMRSPDGLRLAVTVASPPALMLFDVRSGAVLQNVSLPAATGLSTIAWQDLRPHGSFTTYGRGCPGSLGLPTLSASGVPRIGTTTGLTVQGVPNVAVFVFGPSNTMYGTTPLPMSLRSFGMPRCQLLAQPATSLAAIGSGSATVHLAVPNHPIHLGSVLYLQAFSFDATANVLGVSASEGARVLIGH